MPQGAWNYYVATRWQKFSFKIGVRRNYVVNFHVFIRLKLHIYGRNENATEKVQVDIYVFKNEFFIITFILFHSDIHPLVIYLQK